MLNDLEYLRLAKELYGIRQPWELIQFAQELKKIDKYGFIPDNKSDYKFHPDMDLYDFVNECKIHHPAKGLINFNLYPFQIEMISTIENNRFVCLNTARQLGVTFVTAVFAAYQAYTNPNTTILYITNTFNGGTAIIERIKSFGFITSNDTCNKTSIKLSNGSQILVRSANSNSSRGLSLDTVILDNAAFISHSISNDMWASLMPCLKSDSKIIVQSTPNVAKGLFYDIWSGSNTDITRVKYTWDNHPDRDLDWKEKTIKNVGLSAFRSGYECEFNPYIEPNLEKPFKF